MIAAVAIAAEPPLLAQFVQSAGDFAAVVAADRLDEVGIEHRRGGQRLLDILEPGGAFVHLGGASSQRNLAGPAKRSGAVETGFCSGPPPLQRSSHAHSPNSQS